MRTTRVNVLSELYGGVIYRAALKSMSLNIINNIISSKLVLFLNYSNINWILCLQNWKQAKA